jgi:uracil-DNA glycosylase
MDALALLRLQLEWGVDETLAEEPVDRLQARGTGEEALSLPTAGLPTASLPTPSASLPRKKAETRLGTPAARAEAAAQAAHTIEALRAALAAFDGCSLRDTATNLVFADGNTRAGLMLIGEAPDGDEDRSGMPFAGPAGAYLDKMLASIRLDRRHALLTTALPWRPPGNRPPTPTEIATCAPFLIRHIALVRPRRAVLLGSLAGRMLSGRGQRLPRTGWTELEIPRLGAVPALLMPGPAAAMRSGQARSDAWTALRSLRRALDADGLTGW